MKPKPLLAQRLKRWTPRPINAFAKTLDIKPPRYYAYLAGERPPDEILTKIGRAMDPPKSLDELLGPEDERPPRGMRVVQVPGDQEGRGGGAARGTGQTDEEALIAAWRRLDPGRRDYTLMFLEVLAGGANLERALAAAHSYAVAQGRGQAPGARAGNQPTSRPEGGRSARRLPRESRRRGTAT